MSSEPDKHPGGRPTVMTAEVIGKLEAGFAFSFTDREACLYAGINPDTLYEYQKLHPEFAERKEQLKLTPNLKAKQTLVVHLGDVTQARWWTERKDKDFALQTKVEHSGSVAMAPDPAKDDKADALTKEYEDKLFALAIEDGTPKPEPENVPVTTAPAPATEQKGSENTEAPSAGPVAAPDSPKAGV